MCSYLKGKLLYHRKGQRGHSAHTYKESLYNHKKNKKGYETHLPNFKRKSEMDYQGY